MSPVFQSQEQSSERNIFHLKSVLKGHIRPTQLLWILSSPRLHRLKRLCQIANECLLEYLRQITRQPDRQLGMIMTIHTFGEYMGYNCHLHALVADGLFSPSGMVIYRSRKHANTKRNFQVFSAADFIAAITQHIPDKGFQMVRYYGWYSNRARGERAKNAVECAADANPCNLQVIDVRDYEPRRLQSKKWRELIKKVWEVDHLECQRCGCEMKMIALIDDSEVVEKILRHLGFG